jgi:hypothetical protein
MRRFSDARGQVWTAALASGSYGAMEIMFSPQGATTCIFRHSLEARTAAEAQDLLAGLSDETLRERLAHAEEWAD